MPGPRTGLLVVAAPRARRRHEELLAGLLVRHLHGVDEVASLRPLGLDEEEGPQLLQAAGVAACRGAPQGGVSNVRMLLEQLC